MNFSWPAITVLTCCYNAADFVQEAIRSILTQTYPDFEFLIIDDGSTDNTFSILEKFSRKDPRMSLIRKSHTGLADSLNIGLQKAKGRWIARLDADDIALADRLTNQMSFMKNNNEVVLLGGGCIEIDEQGAVIGEHFYPTDHHALLRRLESTEASFFPHSTAFFLKDYIMQLGGYQKRFLRSQDGDLWLRVAEKAKIACLPIPIIKLRWHAKRISETDQGRMQAIMGICALICHYRRKSGLSDPSQLEEEIWQSFLDWVEQHRETKGFLRRWEYFKNNWFHNASLDKIQKYKIIFENFIVNPLGQKILWRMVRGDNIALKLAAESRNLF